MSNTMIHHHAYMDEANKNKGIKSAKNLKKIVSTSVRIRQVRIALRLLL
jgi:hypothetical protein